MKLIIFGATGGTGRELVSQALAQGHNVTAFVRNLEKLQQTHELLQVIKGDVLDRTAVERAISGHDAVLCALGAPAMNKRKIRSTGTEIIITAMQKTGVKRLICQSGYGCGETYALLPFNYKYIIFPLFLRHVFIDHELQERAIKQSQLDWTITRPAALSNDRYTGEYWHGLAPTDTAITIKISRADAADFMLKQLSDNYYLGKTPGLSYRAKNSERMLTTAG
ncbi:Flavin reductase [hydrothermal vent metagenome]|uniref:Flavin reductase n=1 Tax=hydrothermal vent metagenome TaxID=652676 RepID=A0A3B1AL56_9ZZZZ